MNRPENPSVNEEIVKQYVSITKALNVMFYEAGKRNPFEFWRVDGVGSCDIETDVSERLLKDIGPASDDIILRREEINRKNPGEKLPLTCGYHRAGKGCILGDLKSPLCIGHIDMPDSFTEKFGIDSQALKFDIHKILIRILQGGINPEIINPEENEEFTSLAVEAIVTMTNHIKRFPLTTAEEVIEAKEIMSSYIRRPKEFWEDKNSQIFLSPDLESKI